jgi:hypothetical protein
MVTIITRAKATRRRKFRLCITVYLQKLVAGSVHCFYVSGLPRVRLKLAAQLEDMNINSAVKAIKIIAKGFLNKLSPAENPPRFLSQNPQ